MAIEDTSGRGVAERRIALINGLSGSDEKAKRIKISMYNRFGELAEAMYTNPIKESLIRGNPDTFSILCDPTVYMWAFAGRSSYEFGAVAQKYPTIRKLFSSTLELQKGIAKVSEITGKSDQDISFEQLVVGLSSYNPNNIIPLMDDIETPDEDQDDGYFQDEVEGVEATEGIDVNNTINELEDEEEEEPESTTTAEPTEYDDDEPDPEVEANTARVMNVYKELFEVGFELQIPYGILVKEGALKLSKDGRTLLRPVNSLAKLYELINDVAGKFMVQSEIGSSISASNLREVHMRKGTTYYPEFQLGNLFGLLGDTKVDSWEKLSEAIRPEIRRNIQNNIKEGRDIASIVDALTTCIIISEFDPNVAMKLRINIGNGLVNKDRLQSEYYNRKSTIMAGIGDMYYINRLPSGVVEVTLVFNKAAFNGRPLFAYEAVQDLMRRGRKPSLKEMILGQDTSGKIMTVNLDKQNSCVVLIGAGQRSGKGVLTLNILGTILAGGNPLVYLDGKPDMAKVLWNIGKKNGINPAVWDAYNANGHPIGNGAPEAIVRENSDIFGALMYLKALQLMMAAAHLRATKNIMVGGQGKRPFFIFDEALAVQTLIAGAWQGIIKFAKDKKNESEEATWCKVIVQWAEQLSSSLIGTINSQLPMSGISTIWLFQSVQPTSWNQFNTPGLSGDFNILKSPIMSRMSIKMLGRGTTDSEYGLGNKDIKGNKVITERVVSEGGRHFVLTEAQKITDMNLCKVFKPYLVLNESENGTKSAEELKSNVSKDVWNAIAPSGSLPAGAGFEGFATLLGEEAIQNLSLGRAFLQEVMQNIGLSNYASVDDYLYDASAESFKSLGTLLNEQDVPLGTEDGEDIYTTGAGASAGAATASGNPAYTAAKAAQALGNEVGEDESYTGTTAAGIKGGKVVVDRQAEVERAARQALENDTENGMGSDGLNMSDEDILNAVTEGNISPEDAVQILVEKKNQQASTMMGANGRRNVLNPDQTRNSSRLTTENSIDCRRASVGSMSWIEKMTLDTPAGAQRYINKLWKAILNSVVERGNKRANITRVSLHGGQMYVNGKILNLNGVLGGYECIRLRDIVSFRTLFKQFFMVKELRMDEEMLRAATAELGNNPIEQFFSLAPKLEIVYVQAENGTTISIDRSTAQGKAIKRMQDKNKFANDFDMYCANKSNKNWSKRLAGDNIWGLKLAKNAMGNAGTMFMDKNKPRFFRAAVYATAGLAVGTVGSLAWGTAKLVGGVFNLGKMFRKS